MPRLTNQRYVDIHHLLRRDWLENPALYAYLTPNEQWVLHDFFQPYKALTDAELVKHRQSVSRQAPSLPHRAGRALRRFERTGEAIDRWRAQAIVRPAATNHKRLDLSSIKVWALVRPEIDVKMLAKACIGIARLQLADEKRKANEK